MTAPERRRRGRPRAGESGGSREAILAAAAAEFAERGYDGTSLRGTARRAGVDPALVHHYFDGKADLLAAVIAVPLRPDQALDELLAGPRAELGPGLIRFLATELDDPARRTGVVALIKSAVAAQPVGLLTRAFITRELLGRLASVADPPEPELRATLAASQVIGFLVTRYVLELEPLASASIDDVVDRIGPVINRHLFDRN